MKLKLFIIIAVMLVFNLVCYAQIKTFVKEGESVVQKDQSVNQVIAYLKQKLTREAQEEAGTFITTNLKIINYQIKQDEFTTFAGSISKTTVLEEKSFMKDLEQYVKVKIKVDVDIDSVKAYLEKIMQDNEYKEQAQKAIKDAEELRKEKLELENKLKTATKQEYERKLSLEAEKQIQEQKQREIELNKIVIQAKEEYAKFKEQQKQRDAKREQEILKLKGQIAQEKDNIKKAELENQAKIKELELKAKENQKDLNTNTNKISIQQAIQDAIKVKKETAEIINKFETLLEENKEKIIKSYDEQIQLSCDVKERDQWETEEEYNARLEKNKKIREKLENEEKETLFNDEAKTLESMSLTLEPFVSKLYMFQLGNFYDKDGSKAELLNMGEINVDKQYFIMNVKYKNKEYSLKYDFSKIGREKAKLMYQTQNQFVIEPLFFVVERGKKLKVLKSFSIMYRYDLKYHNATCQIDSVKPLIKKEILEIERQINIYNQTKGENWEFVKAIEENNEKQSKQEKYGLEKYKIEEKDISNNTDDTIKILYCDKFNIEEKSFFINFQYANEQYSIKFDFSNIKEKQAKQIYKNPNNIQIIPNIEFQSFETLDKELIAFNVKHLGTEETKILDFEIENFDSELIFEEIIKFVAYRTVNNINQVIINKLKEFTTKKELKKFTGVIEILNDCKYLSKEDKLANTARIYDIIEKSDKIVIALKSSPYHIVGLKKDGTCVAAGWNEHGECNVKDWENIVAIAVSGCLPLITRESGGGHTVGLKKDGTVVATGWNEYGQCNVKGWKDIVAITVSEDHTVGLKKDGTVVATGWNKDGRCNVKDWKNIVAIAASGYHIITNVRGHTVGLKKDGTVVATGNNKDGQCNVKDWKDIVAIAVNSEHTVGLKKNGTVVATGWNKDGRCNVKDWKNIVAIAAGAGYTVGLKKDGTVVATGWNVVGQCNVKDWKDIVAIAAGGGHTVGLKKDGTVVATGQNKKGQCNVKDWKDIVVIYTDVDGTIGIDKYGQCMQTMENKTEEENDTVDEY